MVMNYEVGKSLKEVLRHGHTFTETELIQLLFPLMDGLETVHKTGFVHRDIKPGNIFIREHGGPVLLDFGSARQTRGNFTTKTLTNFVSPGYAPIEQYAGKSDRQGAWTDIYGLGATVYEAMTGNMPEAAVDRSLMISNEAGDNLIKTSLICKGKYSKKFLAAIDHSLAFGTEDRPQTIAEWREEFGIDQTRIDTLKLPASRTNTFAIDTHTEKLDLATRAMTRKTDHVPAMPEHKVTLPLTELPTTIPEPPPAAVRSRYKPSMIVIAAVAVMALSFIGYHTYYWRASQETLTPGSLAEIAPVIDMVTEMFEAEEEVVAVEEAVVELTTEEKVRELLTQASDDIAALRLMSPEDNNAYEKFMRVLTMDQENMDAVRGIDAIADKYLQLVYAAIESKNLERAEQHLMKADYLRPGQPKIVTARKALDDAIKERDRPNTVFGRINRALGNQ